MGKNFHRLVSQLWSTRWSQWGVRHLKTVPRSASSPSACRTSSVRTGERSNTALALNWGNIRDHLFSSIYTFLFLGSLNDFIFLNNYLLIYFVNIYFIILFIWIHDCPMIIIIINTKCIIMNIINNNIKSIKWNLKNIL